jgi:hypothetical protein
LERIGEEGRRVLEEAYRRGGVRIVSFGRRRRRRRTKLPTHTEVRITTHALRGHTTDDGFVQD